MQIYWNKWERLHKKRVQLPQDWFGTQKWPPFHCFGTQIWPPWRHVKTHNTSIFITYIANELEIMLFIILSILTVPMSGKKKSSSAACLVSMRVAGSRSSIFANRSGLLGYLFSTYCLREQWAFSCSLSTCLGFFKLEQSAKITKKIEKSILYTDNNVNNVELFLGYLFCVGCYGVRLYIN